MKEIRITKGCVALVDDEDFEWLNQWKWSYCSGYAARKPGPRGTKPTIFMHRLLAGTPAEMYTDHINGNKLDNRRCNLRICTKSENGLNRGKPENNTSGYKGIWWNETRKKWQAEIVVKGHRYFLGYYSDVTEAARACDNGSIKHCGVFAKLNFPK